MSGDDWHLFEYDPVMLRATYARRAVQNGESGWEVKTEYLVDPTLDANQAERNAASPGWAGDYHKVASLSPAVAYGDGYVATALRQNDNKAVSKWLNDSDHSKWRTKEGQV